MKYSYIITTFFILNLSPPRLLLIILLWSGGLSIIHAQTFNEVLGSEAGNPTSGLNLTATAIQNVLLGDSTGINLTTGDGNIFIGYKSGFNNTASQNVFIGENAGYFNTNDIDNVFIGAEAGYFNDGSDNTFIGTEAGENNTTGSDNTFLGEESGTNNTTGSDNTFLGEDSGFNNTTGEDNCFVGNNAGRQNETGSGNTFVGGVSSSSLIDSVTNILGIEYDISIIGSGGTGYDNNGNGNTFLGSGAGEDVGNAHANTMVGYGAGANTEHASGNTFVGYGAGFDNNRTNELGNATRNTYLGALAGGTNRKGSDNVVIGWNADYTSNTSNSGNNQNVVIGASALHSAASNNTIIIGYQASANTSNSVSIGNTAIQSIGGSVNWTATSDGRYKSDVQENVIGLDFIDRLRPVTYHYDVEKIHSKQGFSIAALCDALSEKAQIRYTGFIAQEVEAAAQALNYDFSGVDTPQHEEDSYGLRYAEFTVPIVKALQELHEKVKQQEQLIQQQQDQLVQQQQKHSEAYQQLLSQMEERLQALEQQVQMQDATNLLSEAKIQN